MSKKEDMVVKRDGTREAWNIDKIHKRAKFLTEGLNVNVSEVELGAKLYRQSLMSSSAIDDALAKSLTNMISEDCPDAQFALSRLYNSVLRKNLYGGPTPRRLFDIVKDNVEIGFYDRNLLEKYSEEEWDYIEKNIVVHDRDFKIPSAGMSQFLEKYAVKNRATGKIYETPQVMYVCIAIELMHSYGETQLEKLDHVKLYYDLISKHFISLPTPIMAGVRTPQKQFSSCTVIQVGDSLKSIAASATATMFYAANRAGIGLGVGAIRSKGSPIRNGDAVHTGIFPFLKYLYAAVASCSQGGVRKGSSTMYYPIWHPEFEELIVLKNNKGTEDNRLRGTDFGVQLNGFFYQRFIEGGNITFFDPHEYPEMYQAFFNDQPLFAKLYLKAEKEAAKDTSKKYKSMSAREVFTTIAQERKSTGRIYIMNVDHSNTHSSMDESVAAIHQSNLCAEVLIRSHPLEDINDGAHENRVRVKTSDLTQFQETKKKYRNVLYRNQPMKEWTIVDKSADKETGYEYFYNLVEDEVPAEIGLCTLSAINWGKINKPSEFEQVCKYTVMALDALLDLQTYPVLAAEVSTINRRNIGVGLVDLAHFLAKNNVKYSDGSALPLVDEYMEAMTFYLIKASNDLAKERGACLRNHETKYSKGIVPLDTRKKEVDTLVPHVERLPWDQLRNDLKTYGVRNSTLINLMPSETSSQLCDATNGIEPPRALVSIKQSKDGVLKQVVPEVRKLKNKYELLWDQKSPEGYLKICAVLNKYCDQSISTNTSYNPKFYPDNVVPMSELIKHMLLAYKWGIKTLYYNNTNDGAGEIDVDKLIEEMDMANKPLVEDEDCDSCKI